MTERGRLCSLGERTEQLILVCNLPYAVRNIEEEIDCSKSESKPDKHVQDQHAVEVRSGPEPENNGTNNNSSHNDGVPCTRDNNGLKDSFWSIGFCLNQSK